MRFYAFDNYRELKIFNSEMNKAQVLNYNAQMKMCRATVDDVCEQTITNSASFYFCALTLIVALFFLYR